MMTDKQIKVIEELLNADGIKGKKLLRHALWMNTNHPKYQVGECFVVSDRGHRVYGYPVKDFNARVVEVNNFGFTKEWRYKLEMEIECDGKKTTSNVYLDEGELYGCQRCEDNKNILGDALVDYEEMDL